MSEKPREEAAEIWDLVIIGAGPAGLTCAIYAGRARLRVLLLEKMLPGGQTTLNDVVENYPGFPEGISGLDLAQRMAEQASRSGAQLETAEVTGLELSGRPFRVRSSADEHQARSLLISTGCRPRRLGAPGEEKLYGRGVSYCATCDGPLYSGKRLMVVGGGDTAVEEALFLAGLAEKVTVVHRRDQLRAQPILQERVLANDKIEFLWSHVLTAVLGDERVHAARVRPAGGGEEKEVPVEGIFIAVGTLPQTDFLPPEIRRDEGGFILTDGDLQTSVPGVFAAGDMRAGSYRQITYAVGDGTLAYRSIFNYLERGS